MRLADHRALDALCGAYLLGTLRGAARRRFERALRDEPRVAHRLATLRARFAPTEAEPAPVTAAELDRGWTRLRRELRLGPAPVPWWQRLGLWQGWAVAATVTLAVVLWRDAPPPEPVLRPIAELADPARATTVAAALSADGRTLALRPSRPVQAGPVQSYELWLLPPGGAAPISVAVLGALDARIEVPERLRERLRAGASLAVSVEPAGGSSTGAPTGPVILVGAIGG